MPLCFYLFIYFFYCGGGGVGDYDLLFSVKENVKDIPTDGNRRKEQQKNEVDFHGYGTANIEIHL